jgi:hypothetical protein
VSAFVAETGLSLEKIQELKWKRRIIKQQTLSDVSTSAEMNDHSANQQNQNLSKSNNNIDRIQETTTTTKGDVVGAHVPLIAGPSKIDTVIVSHFHSHLLYLIDIFLHLSRQHIHTNIQI